MEEAQAKVWAQIVKKDVPKVYRVAVDGCLARQRELKKVSALVQREEKRQTNRLIKTTKNVQVRSKKMMREVSRFLLE